MRNEHASGASAICRYRSSRSARPMAARRLAPNTSSVSRQNTRIKRLREVWLGAAGSAVVPIVRVPLFSRTPGDLMKGGSRTRRIREIGGGEGLFQRLCGVVETAGRHIRHPQVI